MFLSIETQYFKGKYILPYSGIHFSMLIIFTDITALNFEVVYYTHNGSIYLIKNAEKIVIL